MPRQTVDQMKFSKIYPLYLNKVTKKGKTEEDLHTVIKWLTGYTQKGLEKQIAGESTMEEFIDQAPKLNPNRKLIKGVVCGIRVEEVKDPLMRELRYMDKLIEELTRGKKMEKILRK